MGFRQFLGACTCGRAEGIRRGLAAGSEHRGAVSVLCRVSAAEHLKSTEGKTWTLESKRPVLRL